MSNIPKPLDPSQLEWILDHWVIDTQNGYIYNKAGRKLGSVNNHGYVVLTLQNPKRQVQAANLIWWAHYGEWPKEILDHENRIKTDNSVGNLRDSDHSLQMHNRDIKPGKFGRGVHPTNDSKTVKYEARIRLQGRVIVLKRCDTPEEAQLVYLREKIKQGFTHVDQQDQA